MKLGDIARESRETYSGDKTGIPIVGLEHLVSQELRFTDYDIDTDNTFTKRFHKGQILFGRRRAYLKKAAIADFDGICSGDITVIEAIPGKVDPMLLPFIIQNDRLFDYAISHSAGGLSPRVKWADLADYEFDLPSLEEQRRLADKLWAAYELKEAYKKMIAATDEMVKAQFIEMFETLPKENTLSDFCDMKAGKSVPTDSIKSTPQNDLFPCYGGNGLRGYVADYSHDGIYNLIGRQGALCGNITLAKGKFYATEHAVVVTPKTRINEYWLYFALKQMNLNQYSRGVAQPGLAVNQLEKLPFGIPSEELQNRFSVIYNQAEKSKSELRQAIEKIDRVMKSLMQ